MTLCRSPVPRSSFNTARIRESREIGLRSMVVSPLQAALWSRKGMRIPAPGRTAVAVAGSPPYGAAGAKRKDRGVALPPRGGYADVRSADGGTMPEVIECPQCGRKLRVADDLVGRRAKCP